MFESIMVARKKYKERVTISMNTDRETYSQYMELLKKQGLTVSEALTAFMKESIQKNQVWAAINNPIKITYSNIINQPGKKVNTISIPLDRFMEVSEAKSMANQIPLELTIPKVSGYAYHNSKKIMQQLQLRTEGKITV